VLDGTSYLSVLQKRSSPETRRPDLFWHFPGYLGQGEGKWRITPVGVVRSGDWKLLEFFEDNRLELYNLREDVGEKRNRASEMPEKAKDLHARLAAWRRAVKAPMPQPNMPVPATN
jgi:arylsulfatase A-like enzyme